jgi:hypothetical protein
MVLQAVAEKFLKIEVLLMFEKTGLEGPQLVEMMGWLWRCSLLIGVAVYVLWWRGME